MGQDVASPSPQPGGSAGGALAPASPVRDGRSPCPWAPGQAHNAVGAGVPAVAVHPDPLLGAARPADCAAAPAPPPPAAPALQLHDLQPDVLYHVLLFLSQRDLAHIKMCSSRLRSNALAACQHWAPKVEAWLLSDPSRVGLLRQLRDAEPRSQRPGAAIAREQQQQQQQHDGSVPPCESAAAAALHGHLHAAGLLPVLCGSGGSSGAAPAAPAAQQEPAAEQQQAAGALTKEVALPPQLSVAASSRLDWRQVWSCLERAQQGPWQLDAAQLTPTRAPHGVIITFELLLQQPAPPLELAETAAVGWRDSVPIMSFVLDGRAVEILVDASGRVTSPQRDWCQGAIQLIPGQPRLLALEVSYIFPVPAWFLHPCTLAAPRSSGCGGCCAASSCASSVSGMVLDGRDSWDSYSSATTSSSTSMCASVALCSAGPDNSACSLDSSSSTGCSLSSTSTGGSSGGGSCSGGGGGRPRLSLDLGVGFGSYVIDPRYIDEASPCAAHRGLARLELVGRACWRPSKVQAWLGRLLPGIRGHGGSGGGLPLGGGASGAAGAASQGGSGGSVSGGGCGGGHKAGSKPSFAVTVSKAAAWQVPADTERRFAEGFMFWAVQHKLEQLLAHYRII